MPQDGIAHDGAGGSLGHIEAQLDDAPGPVRTGRGRELDEDGVVAGAERLAEDPGLFDPQTIVGVQAHLRRRRADLWDPR
ncbi:hypothetical protein AAG589_08195 [Isoptericola sp. F-RaC21]|uniref:hypothetical protein n=1 Tax=Isoptericola sp. F-RaC21 TaxID=3141452 RepID=UPI00315C319F